MTPTTLPTTRWTMHLKLRAIATVALLSICGLTACVAQANEEVATSKGSVVEVKQTDSGWVLLRNGEPYFIRGAGGHQHLAELAELGGNSIRTWGAEHAGDILDRAHAHGLTVKVGFWMQHERHGFSYSDEAAVAAQLEKIRGYVEKHKDHPALLMWCIGNEAEGDGTNVLVWKAINDAAKMIKQIDPNHPTMTIIAEIGDPKLENFQRHCPDIDVLGINSYGGLMTLGERLAQRNIGKPYAPTEFGPLGQWETALTPWGVPYEQTSSQKAKFCSEAYMASVVGYPNMCLGGYMFQWGNKQEVTPTWFSQILQGGDMTELIDVMSWHWTGKWPDNRAPSIQPIQTPDIDLNKVQPGAEHMARVIARDPDGDALTYEWIVQSETTDRQHGGDFENTPPTHPDAILKQADNSVAFKAPDAPGPYRLFVYVRDGQGHVATANTPFFISE